MGKTPNFRSAMTEDTSDIRSNLTSSARPIETEADHRAALARIDGLMRAEPGTPEGDELDALANQVMIYEARQMSEFASAPKSKQGPPQ